MNGAIPDRPETPLSRRYQTIIMESNQARPFGRILRDVVQSLFIAFIIAVLIRLFFLEAFLVPSPSMKTALMPGDQVLVWKFLYNHSIPFVKEKFRPGFPVRRGEIVVFKLKADEDALIKRVIGLPGDRILLKGEKVWINGSPLNESYLAAERPLQYPGLVFEVPPSHYFVLGDNRLNSTDSRDFGFIRSGQIIGRALLIYYPVNRMRLLKHD